MDSAITITKSEFVDLCLDHGLAVWLMKKEVIHFPYRGWPDQIAIPIIQENVPVAETDLGKKFVEEYKAGQKYV